MSKHTTTIYEYIQSELLGMGKNEFYNFGQLSFNNDDFTFMQKVLNFDDDVKEIVDNKIFKGFKLKDQESDKYFKESFVLRFMDREIGRQTIDAFSSQVLYVTLSRREYINTVFSSEVKKYLENHVTNESEDIGTQEQTSSQNTTNKQTEKGDNTSDNREATSTLPQSEVNLNVDNTELTYADENRISKDKGTSNRETNGEGTNESNQNQDTNNKHDSITKTFSLDNLEKIYNMKEKLYTEFDRKCFLHIW